MRTGAEKTITEFESIKRGIAPCPFFHIVTDALRMACIASGRACACNAVRNVQKLRESSADVPAEEGQGAECQEHR